MIRHALDQLKHQIPLLDYLRAHHWQSTGRSAVVDGWGYALFIRSQAEFRSGHQ